VVPFASVRELAVYYEVHGAGERVVLISGTGGVNSRLEQDTTRGRCSLR
jgi:hypothetical protein